jgi:hypothetical protein
MEKTIRENEIMSRLLFFAVKIVQKKLQSCHFVSFFLWHKD